MLISIDGIDGCGKSTQVKGLAQLLQAEQIQEISDSPWGRKLRSLEQPTFEEQLAYFIADRTVLSPKLHNAAGSTEAHIVSDRSYLSGVAYQSFQSVLTPEMIENINRALVPKYDLMIFLDLPVDVALDRVRKRGEKLTWCENEELLTWARSVFTQWADKHENIVKINANQSIEEVSRDVKAAAEEASKRVFGKILWG